MQHQIHAGVQNREHINRFSSVQKKNVMALAPPNKNLDFLHQKRFAAHPTFYNRLKTSFDIRYILLSLC
jgi:hypothetical protein